MSKFKGLMFAAVLALVGLSGCASYPTAPKAMSHAVNAENPNGVYGEVVGVLREDEFMEKCLSVAKEADELYGAQGYHINSGEAGCKKNVPGYDWAVTMQSKSATKGDYLVPLKVPSSLKVQKGDVLRFRMPTSQSSWQDAFLEIARRADERDSTCPGFSGPPLHEQVVCNGFEAFRDFLPIIKRDEFWSKSDNELGYQSMLEEAYEDLEQVIFDQTGKRVKCADKKCVPVE